MQEKTFAGDKKVGKSFLGGLEKRFVAWGTPRVPKGIETYHLTMLTVLWSVLNVVAGYLAAKDLRWLWVIAADIVLQYVTDVFDGAVGRYRKTGLVKWGYYMDHLLDFMFAESIIVSYYFIAPEDMAVLFLYLAVLIGMLLTNAFLSFAATNKFEIYYFGFGPTELRLGAVVAGIAVIYTGTDYFKYAVPAICVIVTVVFAAVSYKTQKNLWETDMKNR